jgi:hypothetical protein
MRMAFLMAWRAKRYEIAQQLIEKPVVGHVMNMIGHVLEAALA